MNRYLVLAVMLLAACSKDSTGPKKPTPGLDPVVLFNNAGPYSPVQDAVVFTWYDQSGQVQQTTIPWGTQTCIKFTATKLADSVRFMFFAGDTTGQIGHFYKQWSPWFDPKTGIPNAGAGAYPYGAEYWWFDFTKNPYAGTLPAAPC